MMRCDVDRSSRTRTFHSAFQLDRVEVGAKLAGKRDAAKDADAVVAGA